jgi:signal transduction histidine kinase
MPVETRLPADVWSPEIGFWEWDPATDHLTWLNDWPARAGLHPCDGDGHITQLYEVMDPEHRGRLEPAWYAHAEGRRDRYEVEYRVRDLQGRWRWLAMRARIIERDPDGTPRRMVGAAFDIDERRRLEADVERGRSQFEAAAAAVPAWVLLTDRDGRIEFSSRGIDGCSPAALVGRAVAEVAAIGGRTFAARHVGVVETGAPAEYREAGDSGLVHEVRLAPVAVDGAVLGVATSITDVTERVEVERRLLASESDGRRQIGASLRESLSQELAGVAYLLWTAVRRASSEPELVAVLQRAIASVNGSMTTAARLSRGASPAAPEHGGVRKALAELAATSPDRISLRCSLAAGVADQFDVLTGEHVLGVAREALANALGDATVTHVSIELGSAGGRVRLAIVDDGAQARQRYASPGASSMMRFRAEQLGGTFHVDAKPGGATVECAFPLRSTPE